MLRRLLVRVPRVHFSHGNSTHIVSEDNKESRVFEFTPENWTRAEAIMAKYPPFFQRGALMPLLDLAQEQNDNWLPLAAMQKIAKILELPEAEVFEVASFYSMYNRTPVGKYFIQLCTTTPCMVRGGYDVLDAFKEGAKDAKDGLFTVIEVECLGACANAPMAQINNIYVEDLTVESTREIMRKLNAGAGIEGERGNTNPDAVKPGPRNGRRCSEPEGGPTTLLEEPVGPVLHADFDK
eukprot:CAMPEP_0170745896 /NCGR_PEP_ID=MMETSP0437-20130122/8526_1 /TAXON_ID=0 /ORGANISM="Sexangularia sp." /LENGTH=237 /DNA_ID=CAMNT_0011084623 /DNA_START=86 /DNA_END=799 /DNA_ORIENTATION=+